MLQSIPKVEPSPSRWVHAGKFLIGLAALITALGTALVALRETRSKAPEDLSKAAHNELVARIQALNSDLMALDKRIDTQLNQLQQEIYRGTAESKAQTESVRALFTGYALASRQNNVPQKTVQMIRDVVKEAGKKAEKLADTPPPRMKEPPQSKAFKKPKSWETLHKQLQQD